MNRRVGTFAKLLGISVLAAMLPMQTGKSELLLSHRTPSWNPPLSCRPGDWSRAVSWLQSNSLSLETVPEFGNDIHRFKVVRGVLQKFPEVTITIRMKIRTGSSGCEIEMEQYGHELWVSGEQQVRNAKIFADFKSYMQEAPDNKAP